MYIKIIKEHISGISVGKICKMNEAACNSLINSGHAEETNEDEYLIFKGIAKEESEKEEKKEEVGNVEATEKVAKEEEKEEEESDGNGDVEE